MSTITEQSNMTIEAFAQELAEELRTRLSEDYGLSVTTEAKSVLKTNGERLGITVRPEGRFVAPTVYVEEAFQNLLDGETTMDELAEKLSESMYNAIEAAPEMPVLTPDEAKEHITLSVVNTELNREMLLKTPHFEICGGELSAIPRWELSDQASFIVSNDLTCQLGFTADEILQIGQRNIDHQKFVSRPMQDVLAGLLGGDPEDIVPMGGPTMIVVTSETGIRGSSALLSQETLDEVYAKFDGPVVVLPSSISEVICVSADVMPPKELREMVQSINQEQVSPAERLSDEIFVYDGQKLRLVAGDDINMSLAPDNIGFSEDDAPSICMAG